MNVRHSPNKELNTYGDSDRLKATHTVVATGSEPDLRQTKFYESEIEQITLRNKRKHYDDDLSAKFDAFEDRIMAILTTTAEKQNEKLNKISQDISQIKDQVSQMKYTTDRLAEEQNKIKQELLSVTKFNKDTDNRIKTIETSIDSLKSTFSGNSLQSHYDNLISEIHERSERAKNLIISGIDEISSKNAEERRNYDMNQVDKVIKLIVPDCEKPAKVIRLGKFDINKTRPIKAIFATPETPKKILRNKNTLQKESTKIKIYSDETLNQKKAMEILRSELKQRTESGQTDLTIKFVKGTPRIIKNVPKN